MQFLLLGMLALIALLFLIELKRGPHAGIWMRRARIAIGVLVLAVAAGLFMRGLAQPASVLALLGFWLISARGSGVLGLPGGSKTPGQSSEIYTDTLKVALDHDTGELTGYVIKGPFAGEAIESLSAADLIDLWQLCARDDPQSAQVIEALLNSKHPDWRTWSGGHDGDQHANAHAPRPDGVMSRDQAFQVLGLKAGASESEIRAAHRELMQKVHPDRGGSTILAAQINQAKDVLLGEGA